MVQKESWKVKKKKKAFLPRFRRKHLVETEGWALVDGWYWCPETVVEARIAANDPELEDLQITANNTVNLSGGPYTSIVHVSSKALRDKHRAWERWKKSQRQVFGRLAHNCTDGTPRACWIEYYKTRKGMTLKGQCETCQTPLSDGMRAVIRLEKEY